MTNLPQPDHQLRLSDLTTLRVGGPIAREVVVSTEQEFVAAVVACDEAGLPLLVLGGGSNVLASDEPFDGVVVRDARTGIAVRESSACGGSDIVIPAGHSWDDVVATAVANGWSGIEALSGIPGSVGATPVQNVGAYGQEVGDVLAFVRTWDRGTATIRTFAHSELGLGYRTSLLKRSLSEPLDAADPDGPTWGPTPRYVVLEVGLQLPLATLSAPVKYAELARSLGIDVGQRVEAALVRQAVLDLRRGKGMVLDPEDHDTWSAGSFFTNPLLSADDAARLPQDAPRFPVGDGAGRIKTSAAWLISHAGFERGHGLPGPASLSTKHSLALTNRGTASAEDVVELAREVRAGVEQAYGVRLEAEPVLVGVHL